MHNLEREFLELHRDGELDDGAAAQAIALERGTLFSVSGELRLMMYSGVAAISGGLGLLLKKNLDRIGPVAVTIGVAAIAAACYIAAVRLMRRAAALPMGADYLLLLGALLFSADAGYAESQFHWSGAHWEWDLLILAALHAATAYTFGSALVLSLSLASLAAWFGVGTHAVTFLNDHIVSGWSALACAAVTLVWREIHRRAGGAENLREVFEHFAVNVAFLGCIILSSHPATRIWGVAFALVLGAASVTLGLKSLREAFVVYGVLYTAVDVCIVVMDILHDGAPALLLLLLAVLGAAVLLVHWHAQIKERR